MFRCPSLQSFLWAGSALTTLWFVRRVAGDLFDMAIFKLRYERAKLRLECRNLESEVRLLKLRLFAVAERASESRASDEEILNSLCVSGPGCSPSVETVIWATALFAEEWQQRNTHELEIIVTQRKCPVSKADFDFVLQQLTQLLGNPVRSQQTDRFYRFEGARRRLTTGEGGALDDCVIKSKVSNLDVDIPGTPWGFRVNLKDEVPCLPPPGGQIDAPEHVRLKERWSFQVPHEFRFDCTRVQSGSSVADAGLEPWSYELEIECLREDLLHVPPRLVAAKLVRELLSVLLPVGNHVICEIESASVAPPPKHRAL